MFTVLIAEKEHIDAIQQENKLFFEPFLESKELAFCQWNPEGQNLYDSVPGLLDAVGRREKWRVMIINHCKGELLKSRNPFDVVDYSSIDALAEPEYQPESDEMWTQWETDWKEYYKALENKKEEIYRSALTHPLQKLTTWLCYQPEDYVLKEVQERQDVYDWALDKISNDVLKPSDRLESMEREQYKCELRMKENIRKTFVGEERLNITYPAEVHCISLRTAESSFFDPASYWTIKNDSDYSTFADRNMYFDKMRFMVFDLLPSTHRNFRTDYIHFLATVLVFATNPVPGSAMQPRRLYRLEAETDDSPLCTIVTSYDKKLAATSKVIDDEMEKIRSEIPGNLTDRDVEALLLTPKEIEVDVDGSYNTKKVFADNDYGLFFDYPEDEFHKWNCSYDVSKNTLSGIMKQQSRSIRKSVSQAKASSEIGDIDVSRLTSFQIEDIRDYTNNIENEMIDSIPPDLTNLSRYTESLDKQYQTTKNVIRRRMTRKTTITLSFILLGLFLLCFLPFLFLNGSTPKMISTALIFTIAMLSLVAIIMVITLFFLRATVKNEVRNYNKIAQDIVDDIRSSMERFSMYLSMSCNVRRGHAIQNYSLKNVDEYTKRLRIRQKHQEDIRRKRAHLAEEYRDYFADRSFCDEIMSKPYDYDFDQRTEYAYPAPFLAGDSRQIEFISNGNFVTVPSSYIKRITVRMEGIYEK